MGTIWALFDNSLDKKFTNFFPVYAHGVLMGTVWGNCKFVISVWPNNKSSCAKSGPTTWTQCPRTLWALNLFVHRYYSWEQSFKFFCKYPYFYRNTLGTVWAQKFTNFLPKLWLYAQNLYNFLYNFKFC